MLRLHSSMLLRSIPISSSSGGIAASRRLFSSTPPRLGIKAVNGQIVGSNFCISTDGYDKEISPILNACLKNHKFRWDANSKHWTTPVSSENEKVLQELRQLAGLPTSPGTTPEPVAPTSTQSINPPIASAAAVSTMTPTGTAGSDKATLFVEKWASEFTDLLPPGISADSMLAAFRAELRAKNNFSGLEEASVRDAFTKCAQLGLEPGEMGLVYLIPRGGKLNFQIGVKGMIALAKRNSDVISINVHTVRKGDTFGYTLGDTPGINHVRNEPQSDTLTYAYAIARYRNGATKLFVADKKYVDDRMRCSSSATTPQSPWQRFTEEMWKKTALRGLLKQDIVASNVSVSVVDKVVRYLAGQEIDPSIRNIILGESEEVAPEAKSVVGATASEKSAATPKSETVSAAISTPPAN